MRSFQAVARIVSSSDLPAAANAYERQAFAHIRGVGHTDRCRAVRRIRGVFEGRIAASVDAVLLHVRACPEGEGECEGARRRGRGARRVPQGLRFGERIGGEVAPGTYFANAVALAPDDSARIEGIAASMFAQASKTRDAFYGANLRALTKVVAQLNRWRDGGAQGASVRSVVRQFDGVGAELPAGDPQAAACAMLIRPVKA